MLSLLVRRHPRVLSTLVTHVCEKKEATYTCDSSKAALSKRTTIGLEDAKTVLVLPV
jgi:hypothetical protein